MIRRPRLSLKPNVRPSGRASGQGAASNARDGGVVPPAEPVPDPGRDDKTAGPAESSTAPGTGDPVEAQPQGANKAEPFEATAAVSNEPQPSKTTPAPVQRRKRISTLPNLAKPRVSNSAPASVPPLKPSQADIPSAQPISAAPCKIEGPLPEKSKVLSPQKSQVPLTVPQVQHVTLPEKRTPIPQVPQFSPYKKSVLKQDISPVKPVECSLKEEFSPLKERPSQKSLSNELFEVVKKTTPKKLITSNLEKERLKRQKKLRDLLKEELHKERRAWRAKHPVINSVEEPERSKMTMRDFIHYIPINNPMRSSLEETKSSEKSFTVESQPTGLGGKNTAEEDDINDDDDEEEEDQSQLLAPRVKVAEDGSIILDEESLTVEVSRNKAPIVEGNDPIFERGSTTTYSSFRKSSYSKPWSEQETEMFFLAISMVGTDFSMIGQLFPHRERIEIKNKFKKEERVNGWRIDKAFREKKDFDFEFFAQLLEKALEAGKKKKSTSKQPRKTNTKPRKKQKDKAAAEQSLCDEESIISEEEGVDAGTAEKENKRSLDADKCSGVTDPVPVKKKRAKKKKDSTKEPEEENHESQDDEITQKTKKKTSKSKTAGGDKDNRPDRQSGDSDEGPKKTPERKTRVQKNKPNYKEPELEDDENDADFDMTEDFEADDDHESCKAGEAELLSLSVAPTCAEETSLLLFTEESDYQSGLDDLSSMQQSLSEVNEAVSQASDVSVVAPNGLLSEIVPMNITQERTSPSAIDMLDTSDEALDTEIGELDEQDLEPKDQQKTPQGHQAQPATNLSRATEEQSDGKEQVHDMDVEKSDMRIANKESLSVDQQKQMDEAATAEDSSLHNGEKESSIKPTLPGRGRLQRPKPNLPARTSARRENLDITDSKDVPMEGTEKFADVSDVCTQDKNKDAKNPNREAEVSALDKCRQDSSFSVQVSSPVKKDVGSESDLSQTEEPSTVQQDREKGDASKEKPSLPIRGRLRPKPNLTRATGKSKSSDTEQESQCSQGVGVVSGLSVKLPSPGRDQEDEAKERKESCGSQDGCEKSSIKPAPLARGRFQRPKPNLMKATSRKEASADKEESVALSSGQTEGDTGKDSSSGKEEDEGPVNTGPGSSQDSCKSENILHPSSSLELTQDSTVNHDNLPEASHLSETKSAKSPIKPAPLVRGRFQKPKPNLVRAFGSKGEFEEVKESKSFEAASDVAEKRVEGDHLQSSYVRNSTELSKENSSVEQDCSEKPDSTLPLEVKRKNLTEEPSTPPKPVALPKGRFQKPKPNLGNAAAKRMAPKEEASVESPLEAKDTTLNITVSEEETAPMPAKSNKENSVAEEDSVTLEIPNSEASHEKSEESSPKQADEKKTASDAGEKTVKPVLTMARFQRPKPNLNRSATRSVVAAPLVSTVEEEERRAGTQSTDNIDPNVSLEVGVLSNGDAETKSSIGKEPCNKDSAETVAQPVAITDSEQGEAASVKSLRTRFPKPCPNLARATTRKETSTTGPKTLAPEKGEETLKVTDKNPEKNEDTLDTAIAGHSGKEAGLAVEERSAAIKPAALKRGRLIRPVPNLGKQSAKILSPKQTKTNEDSASVPMLKDKEPVAATSSPSNKRKASSCNVDLSPKRICPSPTPQKTCSSDSEVDQDALTIDPQSSSQSGSEQDAVTPQQSRFGRPLRKVSSPPSALPKSEYSSDRSEKEKVVRNVKSSRVAKPGASKSKGKTTLVKIRATQQEEDEEEDAEQGFEEETYDLTPDTQNQAPVFVPFSLRSPKPVTAEIEETVEELEIPVDGVDLQNSTNQDLESTTFHHVVDSQSQSHKKEQCDGSAEAAMALISMGSSVYKPNIAGGNDMSRPGRENNQEQVTSLHLLSSPSVTLLESSNTVEPRTVEDPDTAPNVENTYQTNVISSDFGSVENVPNAVNNSLVFPIEQISYPLMHENSLREDFGSEDTTVSGCFLGEHTTGEEATFILTLVEIPINDDYAYSCDSSIAESLPAPVLISSGSSQTLTQSLNPSVETVQYEPCIVGQNDENPMLGQTSRKRGAECIDEGDQTPLQKKPLVSEVVDQEIEVAAVDGDGEAAVTKARDEEAVSQVNTTAVRGKPRTWPTAKNSNTVPVEMPGMSLSESSTRSLPIVRANPVTTTKTTLKRPGKKPLGFLSLVCQEKQPKKSNEETQKKKDPKRKCRKTSPTVHGSPDVNLESARDSEVPTSMNSPVGIQHTARQGGLPSTSRISDSPEPELQKTSTTPELATEEEAAPVSEYFFSDIFMEVDD
ncbi:transcription factor TFIIIB component B'' homolog isoform X3 [Dendropsophus ebraccatus]|uniref:transcription factor TFIIIB component B'' homolog isoform X3 n=1 Tax=Dendropsophus ebraccatus TaxID=150705 RepID=UPI0038311151